MKTTVMYIILILPIIWFSGPTIVVNGHQLLKNVNSPGSIPTNIIKQVMGILPRTDNDTNIMDELIQSNITQEILKNNYFSKYFGKQGELLETLLKMSQGKSIMPELSKECRNSFDVYLKPFKNDTSINPAVITKFLLSPLGKLLDSWGKPGSRLVLSTWYFIGAYDECHSLNDTKYCNTGFSLFAKISGRYSSCFPKTCNTTDVHKVLGVLQSAAPGVLTFRGDSSCETPKEYNAGFIATMVLFGIILSLCVLGTFTELAQDAFTNKDFIPHQHLPEDDTIEDANEKYVNHVQPENEQQRPLKTRLKFKRGNIITNILISFSLVKNTRAIFSTMVPKGAITAVNGIRTISMTWVILGHVYFFMMMSKNTVDNIAEAAESLRRFSFLPVANAYVSVDTFFLLSGLLVAYLTMRRLDTYGLMSPKDFFMYLIHRYIRLTPSLGIIMLFYNFVVQMIFTGPGADALRKSKEFNKPCNDYWWTNLLYINNFYPKTMGEQCVGWVWYLANDWQFYVISPFILMFIYLLEKKLPAKYVQLAIFMFIALLCSISFLITGILIGVNDYPTLITGFFIPNNPRAADGGSQDVVYQKPYCRISPYLVGIYLGYILHRKKEFKSRHKFVANVIGWSLAFTVALLIIYGPWHVLRPTHQYFMSDAENIMYGTFHRCAFALCVAWVIYSCHNQLGLGLVNDFLSWRVWIPLSRLTYGAYLTHCVILIWFYSVGENRFHYQDQFVPFTFVSVTCMAYTFAYIIGVCVEQPMANLEKIIFRS